MGSSTSVKPKSRYKVINFFLTMMQSFGRDLGLLTYTEWGSLLWLLPAWGIATVYGRVYEFSPLLTAFMSCLWYPLFLLWRAWQRSEGHPYRIFSVTILCIALYLLGLGRATQVITTYSESDTFFEGQEGTYIMHITSMPERIRRGTSETIKLTGDVLGLYAKKEMVGEELLHADGEIIAYVNDASSILPGSYVWVRGTPLHSRSGVEDGQIDRRARMIASLYRGTIYDGTIAAMVTSGTSLPAEIRPPWYEDILSALMQDIGNIHTYVKQAIANRLPASVAALAQTLVLGGSYSLLSSTVMTSFTLTGLIHILSVSGSHIALLFAMVYGIGAIGGIGKERSTYAGIIVAILYCCMVGFNPPVIRATLMGICMGIGVIRGTLYSSRQAIAISAAMLLLYQPMLLLDVSFQLSFGATYGILLLVKPLYRRMPRGMPKVTMPLALCLAAQILMWPVQLYYFHMIGMGTFVAAILVAPLLDLAIIGIVILVLLNIIYAPAFLWDMVGYLLRIAVYINYTIARLPLMTYWIAAPAWWQMVLYYPLCRYYYYWAEEGTKDKAPVYEKGALLCIIVVLFCGPFVEASGTTYIHVIPTAHPSWLAIESHWGRRDVWLYCDMGGRVPSPRLIHTLESDVHYYGATRLRGLVVDGVNAENIYAVNALASYFGIPFSFDAVKKGRYSYVTAGNEEYIPITMETNGVIQVTGLHRSFFFLSQSSGYRQKGQKVLQLKGNPTEIYMHRYGRDRIPCIIGTADEYGLLRQYDSRCDGYVYWPPGRKLREIDPALDGLYVVGHERIPDIEL